MCLNLGFKECQELPAVLQTGSKYRLPEEWRGRGCDEQESCASEKYEAPDAFLGQSASPFPLCHCDTLFGWTDADIENASTLATASCWVGDAKFTSENTPDFSSASTIGGTEAP